MRVLILFTVFALLSCNGFSKETTIISKTKIDWKDYPHVYSDSSQTNFKPQLTSLAELDFYEIIYWSDGLKIQAFAAAPKGAKNLPVIIFNRGGNRDFGALWMQKWERGKYPVPQGFSTLAKEGYLVIGCNYRGSGKSEGKDEFGGNDLNDVLNLFKVIDELPEADPERIGMYGWSRGGMMAYMAMPKTKSIKVLVVGGAPTDKTVVDRPSMERGVYAELIPNYWKNKKKELIKRSSIYFVKKMPKNVPILILHGEADQRVKVSDAIEMERRLKLNNHPCELTVFKGGNHGLMNYSKQRNEAVLDWFAKHL